ncbi:MAG: hypothetical protein ACK6CU_02825 [Deltaproteobacteria bacterium]
MPQPHRLHWIILAQLAGLGCADRSSAPTPAVPTPAVPAATVPMASPSTTAAVVPAPATFPPPQHVGDPCSAAVPCPPPLQCQLSFDGAHFSETGVCTNGPVVYEGRPLVVDGMPRTATLIDGGSAAPMSDPLVPRLLLAAREEHASIAAFGRTLLALLHLGAPTDLLRATQEALADEIRHAEDLLAAAVRHGAAPVTFGPLPEATAEFRGDVAAGLLEEVLTGGCIGETLAAFRAEARAAAHPSIRALCLRIADDEARHAALAFATVRFLVARRADLVPTVDARFARFRAEANASELACVAPVWDAALH